MRVLFTCIPGFGHFNPLVPLARALARAGHEVAFATAEELCPRVRQAGFAAFPAGMSLGRQLEEAGRRYPEAGLPPGKERFESFVPKMLAGVAAPARAADLVPLTREWRPDLLVHDEAELAGPIAAEVAGIAYAAHSIVLARPRAMICLAGEVLAPLCDEWGVDLGPLGGLYRYLYLTACPPSLQGPHIDDVSVAQPIRNTDDLDTAEGESVPPWVARLPAAPTVYVTLGTAFSRDPAAYKAVLEGAGGHAVNVIATVGYDNDPAALGPQPENVRVERYIPLSLLLPHLDLMVTQGGTSILPALSRGLPLLVVPRGADQFHNAEACVRAGVGLRLPPSELSSEGVHREVARLLADLSFRESARRVQREIRLTPGPDTIVPLLERLAREREPVIT